MLLYLLGESIGTGEGAGRDRASMRGRATESQGKALMVVEVPLGILGSLGQGLHWSRWRQVVSGTSPDTG